MTRGKFLASLLMLPAAFLMPKWAGAKVLETRRQNPMSNGLDMERQAFEEGDWITALWKDGKWSRVS